MRGTIWARSIAAVLALLLASGLPRVHAQSISFAIVQLQQGADINAVQTATGDAVDTGDSTTGIYRLALSSSSDPATALQALQGTSGVGTAELDQNVLAPEAQQSHFHFFEGTLTSAQLASQYALQLIGASSAQALSSGAGVTVAVLDTGVAADHPALAGHLVPGYNVLDPGSAPADVPTSVDSDGDGLLNLAAGHGTAVAGIIALVAPQAQIMPIKVLDSEGMGSVFNVAEGIRYAADHGAQIINLSLGMPSFSHAVTDAISYAQNKGIAVVAAAGNTGLGNLLYPAANRDSNIVAVAATDQTDHKADFSAYGNSVALSAPGVDIICPYYDGNYAVWSGTSMAAPFVSGALALRYAAQPGQGGVGGEHFVSYLQDKARSLSRLNPLYSGKLGEGRLNLGSEGSDGQGSLGSGGLGSGGSDN